MKVRKLLTTETEVEVDINAEDITKALKDHEDSQTEWLSLINSCAQVLNAIPDSAINEMYESQRKIIREFLLKASKKF